METVEILAGGEFANAVKGLELTSAKCTYRYNPPEGSYREDYQIWLLSKEDFDNLCAITDSEWQKDWGWWRHNGGYNGGSVNGEFIVHGKKIRAWDKPERENFFEEECKQCSDYNNGYCSGKESEQDSCLGGREYKDLLAYIHEEMNLSTETNVCALCISLAYYNGLTLSELFRKYLGGESE